MMQRLAITLVIVWVTLTPQSHADTSPPSESSRISGIEAVLKRVGVSIEPPRRMRAEGFQWDHEIQIALPPSYRSGDKKYPVLWVTDGYSNFEPAVEIVNRSAKKHLPEMIVVAVGIPPDALNELQMRRVYDFSTPGVQGFDGFGSKVFDQQTQIVEEGLKAAGMAPATQRGGAAGFLTFLVQQVRPVLSRDYRMSDDHTLFGQSAGGFFCTYALLAKPEAFDKYVCSSPNLYQGNMELFRVEERYAQAHNDLRANVFFGAGEGEVLEGGWISAWGIVSSMTRMAEILRLRPYSSLRLHVRIFPGEDHSVGLTSLRWGLRTLWEVHE